MDDCYFASIQAPAWSVDTPPCLIFDEGTTGKAAILSSYEIVGQKPFTPRVHLYIDGLLP